MRVGVNVLVEPQVKPIKHCPVVTVSHKLILPTIPHFASALTPVLGRDWSLFVTGTTDGQVCNMRPLGCNNFGRRCSGGVQKQMARPPPQRLQKLPRVRGVKAIVLLRGNCEAPSNLPLQPMTRP